MLGRKLTNPYMILGRKQSTAPMTLGKKMSYPNKRQIAPHQPHENHHHKSPLEK